MGLSCIQVLQVLQNTPAAVNKANTYLRSVRQYLNLIESGMPGEYIDARWSHVYLVQMWLVLSHVCKKVAFSQPAFYGHLSLSSNRSNNRTVRYTAHWINKSPIATYTHTHTHTRRYQHTHTPTPTSTQSHILTHTHTHTPISTHTHPRQHQHSHIYSHTHADVNRHTYAHTHRSISTHTHTHTH